MARGKLPPEFTMIQRNVGAFPEHWARWGVAAARDRMTRQQWIRDTLNAAAERSERSERLA
jgi:hypothetical protein